ncbi:MAG TPA: hypothetical protein VKB18_07940 [Gemmatimonadota bacterium]|nr:hypothetical protein [Gemmatimonadota bacterium]
MERRDRLNALAEELEERFAAWGRDPRPWPDDLFGELALRAFELQFEHVPVYREYCRRRGADPASVDGWRAVPPVPTAAFREVELTVAAPGPGDLVFRTSGTTRGGGRRGTHRVTHPDLYRAALRPPFARFVLGGSRGRAEAGRARAGGRPAGEGAGAGAEAIRDHRIGSLVTAFEEAPDSSLSFMCDDVLRTFGAPGSRQLAGESGPDAGAALAFAEGCAADGVPACLLATTLGLDAWLRELEAGGTSVELPAGSVIMDTGGAKGRDGLERDDVLRRARSALGVPPGRVVNELGMTELLSQRYGRVPGRPLLEGPPWLKTRVLDPTTLEPLPEGEAGVLCHVDLANAGSAVAVLTEDLGRMRGGALEWVGRSPGAPPRGCSLATAELLEARGARG